MEGSAIKADAQMVVKVEFGFIAFLKRPESIMIQPAVVQHAKKVSARTFRTNRCHVNDCELLRSG
jgi:hypothetical protein